MSFHASDWAALTDKITGFIKDHPWPLGVVVALLVGLVVGRLHG